LAAAILLCVVNTVNVAAADEERPKLGAGDQPPLYVGRQLDGTDVNLDPASGKAYVISFWATWCGPCMQELPILGNIQKAAGPDRMRVIAVNIEDRVVYRKVEHLILETGLTPAYDPQRASQDAYGVHGIPHMVIIGRDGLITSVRRGYARSSLDDIAAELNKALAAKPRKKDAER
jgi:thiol-disulfide isomerase/thioredoxin